MHSSIKAYDSDEMMGFALVGYPLPSTPDSATAAESSLAAWPVHSACLRLARTPLLYSLVLTHALVVRTSVVKCEATWGGNGTEVDVRIWRCEL